MGNMKKIIGTIGLLLVAMIWGSGFVVSDIALGTYHPLQINALRFLIAGILSILFFWKKLQHLRWKTIQKGCVLGIVLFAAFLLQTLGLAETTASKNAFLTAVNVVLVPILGFLIYRFPLQRKTLFGAFFTLIGIGLISLDHLGAINRGDLLTLLCAVLFAFQILLTSRFLAKEDAIELTVIQLNTAGILGLIFCLFAGLPLYHAQWQGNAAVFYLGAFSTLLAYLIQTSVQKWISSAETAVILSLESFFGMVGSVLVLHEALTPKLIGGAALILCGVLITEWQPKRTLVRMAQKGLDQEE